MSQTYALALPVLVADWGVIVEVKTDAQLLYERLESARDMMRLAWYYDADDVIAMEMHQSAGKAWRWALVMAAGNFAGVAGPVSRRRAVQRLRLETERLRNASSALRTPIPCGWSGDDRADGAKGVDRREHYTAFPSGSGWAFETPVGVSDGHFSKSDCQRRADVTRRQDEERRLKAGGAL